ncbi:unnamed protein product [Lota lota]
MASTIKQVLLGTLEDLTKKDLKKFCAGLLDREGEPRVRRNALQDKDEIEIVDVLVSTFTEAEAGRVAFEILKAIGCNDDAVKLETNLEKLKQPGSLPSAQTRPGVHFVDHHRNSLIQRIRSVPAILDKLLEQNVLSQEQYDTILAQRTMQDQVRQLYSGPLMSSGTKGKDVFLSVLEKTEPFLIEDLRGQ